MSRAVPRELSTATTQRKGIDQDNSPKIVGPADANVSGPNGIDATVQMPCAIAPTNAITPAARKTFCNGNWRRSDERIAKVVVSNKTASVQFGAPGNLG
jgi:hypothetical protein